MARPPVGVRGRLAPVDLGHGPCPRVSCAGRPRPRTLSEGVLRRSISSRVGVRGCSGALDLHAGRGRRVLAAGRSRRGRASDRADRRSIPATDPPTGPAGAPDASSPPSGTVRRRDRPRPGTLPDPSLPSSTSTSVGRRPAGVSMDLLDRGGAHGAGFPRCRPPSFGARRRPGSPRTRAPRAPHEHRRPRPGPAPGARRRTRAPRRAAAEAQPPRGRGPQDTNPRLDAAKPRFQPGVRCRAARVSGRSRWYRPRWL